MADEEAPAPHGPVPSERQLAWHSLEFYGFVHFTVNTFTGKEWGYGDESPELFNPSTFDADQIAGAAARGGMLGLILTCKHHDGFCLWPSRYTEHSVKNSPWMNGRGDAVRAFSEACAAHGLRFGIYLSPWDRNHPKYGRPAYIGYYRNQLRELLTGYGPLFEVWFDGANGGDGFYGGAREHRQIDAGIYYEWEKTWEAIRELQPGACIFGDAGSDIRWVGNEAGIAGDPCWHTIRHARALPGDTGTTLLNSGERGESDWAPAECDVSIRPGWFYHPEEDDRVRAPENLVDLYFKSVGRGASLLLNLPPDMRGQLHDNDIRSLLGFRERLDQIFGNDLARQGQVTASDFRGMRSQFAPENLTNGCRDTYWATGDRVRDAEVTLVFPEPVAFNIVELREHLPLGQRVGDFMIDVDHHGNWAPYARGTAVGNRRLVRGPLVTTERVRLRLGDCAAAPALSGLSLYRDPLAHA